MVLNKIKKISCFIVVLFQSHLVISKKNLSFVVVPDQHLSLRHVSLTRHPPNIAGHGFHEYPSPVCTPSTFAFPKPMALVLSIITAATVFVEEFPSCISSPTSPLPTTGIAIFFHQVI